MRPGSRLAPSRRLGLLLAGLCGLLAAGPAAAQTGPGLGNLRYDASELMQPLSFIESPRGHGNVAMVRGWLMVIYSSDGGGNETNGGIELWDVSNPRQPQRVLQRDDAETHELREAHGFSLARYDDALLLATQGVTGVQIWDVSDPMALRLRAYLDLPGIDRGDYSGAWWTFWQAPWLFVAGVDSGLLVVDVSDPDAPVLAAQVPTGELGGVSPAQVFVLGNLAVVMESQRRGFATLDVSDPRAPRLLRRVDGRAGYSSIFAADGKILTSGNIPPRAHFFQVSPEGAVRELDTVGFFLDSGGYGSYQDGIFHSGWSDDYVKFRISPAEVLGTASSGRTDRDEDFATVLGNLVFIGDDHGVGSALVPHQIEPDTQPPLVEWMHPPDGSADLPRTTRVGLSFSDHIDAASLGPDTIWLEDEGGRRIPARRSAQLSLVNLSPIAPLPILSRLRLVAEGVRDVAGNPSPRFEATITIGDGSSDTDLTAAVGPVEVDIARGRSALGVFAAGRLVYGDRDYTFTSTHPPRFDRQVYVQTSQVDRRNFLSDFMRFELYRPSEVAVLFDARATALPNWLGDFTPTGETVGTTDVPFDVYARRAQPGTVTLGGNNALGSRGADSMYSVVIVPDPVPCEVDLSPVETGTVTLSALGPPGGGFEWRIDDRAFSGPAPRVFLAPGRHSIQLTVRDGPVIARCGGVKIAVRRPARVPARTASGLVWSGAASLSVDPDARLVVRHEPARDAAAWRTPIEGRPETLALADDGSIWVASREPAGLSVLGPDGRLRRRVRLPHGSAPWGVVVAPGGAVYVSLQGSGEVIALDADGTIVARAPVPTARGLTWFDGRIYATRFLSPDTHGEVHVLDADGLAPLGVVELAYDPGPDTEAAGRGVPNYVSELRVSPDGRRAWVSSKKDNTARGLFRDGQPLSFESRVRTIVSEIDLETGRERLERRLDINDRELALSTLSSPLGDLLFVASHGARMIDVFDVERGERISQLEVGLGARAMGIDAAGRRLAVLCALDREVEYFDVEALFAGRGNLVPRLAALPTAEREPLDPLVHQGQRIFHDAADGRMSRDRYLSCASCHLDGGHDARVWDFTQAGEGLRNTIALRGRAGTAHGRVHWTANFDEIQDFEHDIRGAFGGTGFLSDEDFARTSDPLGVPKAGLSPELDALAAYVASLDTVPPSPHRAEDGTLGAEARRGRLVFAEAGCARCHAGAAFTDRQRHDVGTATTSSGLGIGAPLAGVGFDTPTLLGVWEGAPYLHDGSAATLELALDRHGEVPPLDPSARAELIAYLLALDSTSLAPELPCDTGPDECVPRDPPADAGVSEDAGLAAPDAGLTDAGAAPEPLPEADGCGCAALPATPDASSPRTPVLVLALGLAWAARRRRSIRAREAGRAAGPRASSEA